jgi:hypothetical protein
MIHHPTKYRPMSDHYAVGISTSLPDSNQPSYVLAQISQTRAPLSADEARHFAQLLLEAADKIEGHVNG